MNTDNSLTLKPKLNNAKAPVMVKHIGLSTKVNFDIHCRTRLAHSLHDSASAHVSCTIGIVSTVDRFGTGVE